MPNPHAVFKLVFVPDTSELKNVKDPSNIQEPHKTYQVGAKDVREALAIISPLVRCDMSAPWTRGTKIKCVYAKQV
jgi:hypothetical protein